MNKSLITTALFAIMTHAAHAGVATLSTDEPATDILSFFNPTGNINSNIFPLTGTAPAPIVGNNNHGRGELLTLASGTNSTVEISSVTIIKNGGQTFANDTLTLYVFQGTEAEWTTGIGHVETDPTYYEGTTVTPLYSEEFTIDGTIAANSFVTLPLTTPLSIDGDADMGFFLLYTPAAGTSPDRFGYSENQNAGGRRISVTTTGHGGVGTRGMDYYIQGVVTAVGFFEPTISASAELIESGDSVDLDITFDPTAESADLTTPSGTVNLLTIDASDTTPNDGIVVVTESPTSTFTYEVVTAKTGVDPSSASVEIIVVDPSLEAADNDFSTAIKGDDPLFYYRFEEEAGTAFLLDSSGNGNHTSAITGNVTFGDGPGGMQKAANFAFGSAIEVPAASEMSSDFTLVAVMNVPDFSTTALANIFSMANGTGNGRSIFFYGNGGFKSFLAGSTASLTDVDALRDNTSCLIHAVYDSDPDDDLLTTEGEMSVYVNGVAYGTPVTLLEFPANFGEWILGSNKSIATQSYIGWLDETAVFESELSDAQIAAHATAFFAAADPLLGFYADTEELTLGDSVTLTWKVGDAATGVTLDGEAVTGNSVTLSPTETTVYELVVSSLAGSVTQFITITVLSPPGPAVITSCSTAPGNSGVDFSLEILGSPNTDYEVFFSTTLNDDFESTAVVISTDGSGVGSGVVPGIGNPAEFYKVVAQ